MSDYALHYGRSKKPLLFVVADSEYPSMYRVLELEGQLSGLLNLTRAREAGRLMARNFNLMPSHDPTDLHWKELRQGCPGATADALEWARGTLVALGVQNEPTLAAPATK